jgi:Protein of unknown function (DUF3293)
MTKPEREIETTYLRAIYVVFDEEKEIIFRIGARSAAIDEILKKNHANSFAFITAYNPRSEIKSETENETRQKELEIVLNDINFKFFYGYGTDENRTWQPEKSVFVFNISKAEAARLGREFEQNGIVYGEKGEEIELVWCAPD